MTEPTPPAEPQPPVQPPAAPQPYVQQPYAQPQPAYGYAPRTNTLAIVSLVLSLVGLATGITAIGGIICGHIALKQIKQTGEQGHGLALGGLIAGYVIVGLGLLLIVFYIIFLVVILGAAGASGSLYY